MSILSQHPHQIVGALSAAEGLLKDVRDVQPTFMTPEDKETALLAGRRLMAQLAELDLRILAVADEDYVQGRGFRDAASWLGGTTHTDPATARADVALAEALDRRWTRVAAGMADGRVSVAHARVIVDALDELPDHVGQDVRDDAEALLVEHATQFRPSDLKRLGRHILDVVAPEIAEAEEAKKLAEEEANAHDRASLRLRRLGNGLTRLSGKIPDADATRLETYLEAFTSPRHRDPAAGPRDDDPVPGPFGTERTEQPQVGCYGEGDRIPRHRKLAHAFSALLEHLDPRRLPEHSGDATTLLVTVSLDALRSELATAGIIGPGLAHGPDLTAAQARRLACQARIIPVVLGGKGEVLDLGRSRRLFNPAQRKAIRFRDKRCRAKGCRVKAQWTEIHHLDPWSGGGSTDLANGICLCPWHHHRIDDPRFVHERLPDGDILIRRRT